MTIGQLIRNYDEGLVTPLQEAERVWEAANRWQESTNAFIERDKGRLVQSANASAQRYARHAPEGPLDGVVIGVKDLIDVKGLDTTAGSRVIREQRAERDAEVIGRLRAAGAIVDLGKLNLHEFAYGPTGTGSAFGAMRNPWNPTRMAGGSSGGSGAAVAADVVPVALGTDTGGSIRIPAALCGVAGFKPSYDLVSRDGVLPLSWTLDHVGPLAYTVSDITRIMDVLVGPSADQGKFQHTTSQPTEVGSRRKIFWPVGPETDPYQAEVAVAVQKAATVFADAGIEIVRGKIPHLATIRTLQSAILAAEAAAYHWPWLQTQAHAYQPDVRERLISRMAYPAVAYINALRQRHRMIDQLLEWMTSYDAILLATTPIAAPSVETTYITTPLGSEEDVRATVTRLTGPFNLLGFPALALPAGFNREGLPLSIQLVGALGDDRNVLALGQWFQSVTTFHHARPTMPKP